MNKTNKIYISFDFEGIGGVAFWSETINNKDFAKLATKQLVSFCKGITTADTNAQIVVSDSHSLGRNIIWEMLPENVQFIKGYPRNNYMVQSLDETFTHLVLFGYHTSIGGGGMMDHTYSSSSIYEVKINGKPVDEGTINALYASEFGVPLAFVYGDDKTAEYYNHNFPQVDTLISKKAISRFSGQLYSETYLLKKLQEKGENLINIKGQVLDWSRDITCQITLTDSTRAYLASVIPGVNLIDSRIIQFNPKDYKELYRYLMTIIYVTVMAKSIH